jgi:hypothetical protein
MVSFTASHPQANKDLAQRHKDTKTHKGKYFNFVETHGRVFLHFFSSPILSNNYSDRLAKVQQNYYTL